MSVFESRSEVFRETKDKKEAYVTNGPAVACVGWIPFYANLNEMPLNDYRGHRLAHTTFKPSAFSVLFGAGNPTDTSDASNPSPASFADRAQFLEMVASKNFRAALAIDELNIWWNTLQQPIRMSFKFLGEIGFTPIRIQASGFRWFQYYDRGRGSANCLKPQSDGRAIHLDCFIRFKLGSISDYGSLVLTGKWAPSALLKLSYVVDPERVHIQVIGTTIPSQSYYIGWSRRGLHDMLTNDVRLIDSFLEAGACKDAFCKRHESWSTTASTIAL